MASAPESTVPAPTAADVTVAVLTAGRSPLLRDVLDAIGNGTPRAQLRILWSGRDGPPADLERQAEVRRIPPSEFDHGRTRQLVLDSCRTPFLAFLSDDAVPTSGGWLETLLAGFGDPRVGVVFGRQIARPEHGLAERVFRTVRYPATSFTWVADSAHRAAPLALPVSDANVGYRTEALRRCGGFPSPCPFGEDQVVAERLLASGWAAAYCADASVWHSHRQSWRSLLERGYHSGLAETVARSEGGAGGTVGAGGRLFTRMVAAGWREAGLAGALVLLGGAGLRAIGYATARVRRPLERRRTGRSA